MRYRMLQLSLFNLADPALAEDNGQMEQKSLYRFMSLLLLTGLLSIGTALVGLPSAIAIPTSAIVTGGHFTGGQFDRLAQQPAPARTKVARIPTPELPPALRAGELFRAISSGGLLGRTYQTTLMRDGRLIQVRVNFNGTTSAPQVRQVSPTAVQQFQKVLEQTQLNQFHRFDFPAARGSADVITVTLSTHAGTVRYADSIQKQLPQKLQTLIQAWNQMVRS